MRAEPQSFDRVLSSMCTTTVPAAREAALQFLESNPGDPATFPVIDDLEQEAINYLGEIAELTKPAGYITSGGTEANIQALRLAKKRYNHETLNNPNVIVPETGHFSFAKAADLLDIEVQWMPTDTDYTVDVSAVHENLNDDTIAIVGIAGSTEYGRVDPIPSLGAIAARHDVLFHVDAAWGGFALPFTDHAWSFADAPVDTMTIDPHKLGRAPIPAGGLLVRSDQMLTSLATETPYLETTSQVTLTGTRSGAGVAGTTAALRALWPDGYEQMITEQQATASWLADQLRARDFEVIAPQLPLVPVKMEEKIVEQLRDRGWRISQTNGGPVRIVCMPHVDRPQLREFLTDLDAIAADRTTTQA